MRRAAFTLLEVLVALVVVMLLVASATATFLQLRAMIRRIQARQALTDTARIVFDRLRGECEAMVHAGAWWLRAGPGGGVELVFLRGKLDSLDFSIASDGSNPKALTDLVWTRLRWDPATRDLSLAASTPLRQFQIAGSWASPSGRDFKAAHVAVLPQAVRQAAGGPQAVLDVNRLGLADPGDLGDYGDLLANAVPLATGCTRLAIQAVLNDGSTVDADGLASVVRDGDGVPVDGRGAAWAARPRLLRLLLTLQAPDSRIDPATGADDPATVVQRTFSFTFRTPGPCR